MIKPSRFVSVNVSTKGTRQNSQNKDKLVLNDMESSEGRNRHTLIMKHPTPVGIDGQEEF